ncbi:3720_t:CDS:10 [Ambispora leptoticha]|uniref:non-specific serine/threonine protein kinase n=1 Tax=Ambispora leptoticha TaxID=144679 RepID=A0A9N8WC22_9GLOM|nr:3720_t:CDS:10 [Ambispora leptoticha]
MSLVSTIRDTLYGVTSCCFPNPTLYINRRTFKVIQLLGEGGFSFVYLVKDVSTGRHFALKKIRCPAESGAVKDAMKEVEMYKLFQHENIIKVIDTCVVQDKDGKVIYIFLPYYKRGNLQDAISKNLIDNTHFEERDMLKLFRQICYAVRALHTYQLPSVPMRSNHPLSTNTTSTITSENENNEQQEENGRTIVPFAHRDIKPGNVLISDDGETAILMDFGSLVRARIKVQSRPQAMLQQDMAATHSTMPYRAPELFEVQTNAMLTEKVDIWSLGCTLYAMAYGKSPFETSITEQGGSIKLAVLNSQFRFPETERELYSQQFQDLISFMLVVDPNERPDIHQVIAKIDKILEEINSNKNNIITMAANSASSRQSSDSKIHSVDEQRRSGHSDDGDLKTYDNKKDYKATIHEEGKMFIGGLNWETTDESLKSHFSQFGEVTDVIVMRDPNTGRSRGFGFLTFVDPSVVNTVLVKEHQLDGKIIDPKRAIPREEQEKTEKIFVGGIAPEVTEEEFKEYFMQFGNVIDATLMVDRETGRPRGFGFITFDSSEPVEKAMARDDLEIQNKPVEVKRAMPKHKSQRMQLYNQPSFSGSSGPQASAAALSVMPPSAGSTSRYGQSYGAAAGKDGGMGYSGMGYTAGSYPNYAGYGQYSGYNYASNYPAGYSGYANSYGQYGGGYGSSGSGSRGGGSYNQWYRGSDTGYGSGGASSTGGASPLGGGPSSSASRIVGGGGSYHRGSPSRDAEGGYGSRGDHHYQGPALYNRGSSRTSGPVRSSYSSGMQSNNNGGPLHSSAQVRGQHNYHPYAR